MRAPYGDGAVAWERADGRLAVRVEVPVGATAVVQVPGTAGPVEVRHGAHEWHVADAWAAADGLPAGATVRDVLDHAPAWRRVVAAASELGFVDGEAAAAAQLAPWLDAPAAALVDALPPPLRPGADALRERLADVLLAGAAAA
jgi:alpha-L-rhamnosidase